MGSDDIHKRKKRERRSRKEATKDLTPYRFLIVCEGEKTEPSYFMPLKKKLEEKFKDLVNIKVMKKTEFIEVHGTGRNTESLVEYTKKQSRDAIIPFGHIWCVFDKDSFTPSQFNDAICDAKNNNMKVAWSNEAIELWFLLHFEFINTGITRDQYIDKLNKYFKDYGIGNGKYEKNSKDIYDLLETYGSQKLAISNAKKLLREGTDYANMKPATTVFELVEELKSYL